MLDAALTSSIGQCLKFQAKVYDAIPASEFMLTRYNHVDLPLSFPKKPPEKLMKRFHRVWSILISETIKKATSASTAVFFPLFSVVDGARVACTFHNRGLCETVNKHREIWIRLMHVFDQRPEWIGDELSTNKHRPNEHTSCSRMINDFMKREILQTQTLMLFKSLSICLHRKRYIRR